MNPPYTEATSGTKARAEIQKILQYFNCERVGFMDDFANHTVMLAFTYRGRDVQLTASAEGWAAVYLKENPWHSGRHLTEDKYKERWLRQGMIATNSVLRDWVKGQITAVETGVLKFEHVFMPYMLASDGRSMVEHMSEHLQLEGPQE